MQHVEEEKSLLLCRNRPSGPNSKRLFRFTHGIDSRSSNKPLATLLNLPEKDAQESAQVIVAIKRWLQQSTSYLLILDNADDLTLAREFLPPVCSGHVLLTTRAQSTGRLAQRVEVDILTGEQGVEFLLKRVICS